VASYFPVTTFATPPTLMKGSLYHIVFDNLSGTPSADFVSLNALLTYNSPSPEQPGMADTDWGASIWQGSWARRQGYTPILQLTYAGGPIQGMGYMESWVGSPETISGAASVRESFSVSGGDYTVSSASVRLKRVSGTSALSVRLERSDGTLLVTGSIPAANIAISDPAAEPGSSWVAATLSRPLTLQAGASYNLVLSTAAGTTYSIFAIRKGSSYGFAPSTYFADGHAQFTAGSSWTDFEAWGTPSPEGDLQFYFR